MYVGSGGDDHVSPYGVESGDKVTAPSAHDDISIHNVQQ